MGVDEDIQNIYTSIYNINITLANIDQGLGDALNGMNFGLGVFDDHVNMVVQTVNNAKSNIVTKVELFPHRWLYLLILLFLILLLLALVAYLVVYIVKYIINRQQRLDDYRMWYLKNVMKEKFKNEDVELYYSDEEEEEEERNLKYPVNREFETRGSGVQEDIPPPSYSEYFQTEEIDGRYRGEYDYRPVPQATSITQKYQPRKGQEYSTLI